MGSTPPFLPASQVSSDSFQANDSPVNEIQFLPTRLLDDWMRRRPHTRMIPDDLNSITILIFLTLLRRMCTEGSPGSTEMELLSLLSAQCPYQLWMNRQQARDIIKSVVEDKHTSQLSTCDTQFAAFLPTLYDLLQVNDDQRWEMHKLRAEGKLDRLAGDSDSAARYYRDYVCAFAKMLDSEKQ